jgi:rhodanese-related sulfurtransferase
MQKIFLFLFSTAILCSCKAQTVKKLNSSEFEKEIVQSNVQILDVRTATEYNNGHIKNAMQANWNDQIEFIKRVAALDKNKPLYVYCQAGGRSAAAAKWFADNGFNNVNDLAGGMISWKKENKYLEAEIATPQLLKTDFDKMISDNSKTYLIDFGATWCPPCVKMKPILEALIKENKDQFVFINIDAGIHISLMKELGVEGLPTFLVYKNGKQTWKHEGTATKEELLAQVK